MDGRDRRQERRRRRQATKAARAVIKRTERCAPTPRPQAAPAPALSPVEARRGLVVRLKGTLVRRRVLAALSTPAAAGLVAVTVVAVFAAVALGALLGAALAHRGGGDWS